MSAYTQIMYDIVFSTKNRVRCLTADRREDLFRYIWGIVNNHQCHLYRINGVEDHLHILSSLHPSVCLADFVKAVKTGASRWIKDERAFPAFTQWQDGYAAFTHSMADKNRLIEYIRNQAEHHRARSFEEELARLLTEAGVSFEPKYLV